MTIGTGILVTRIEHSIKPGMHGLFSIDLDNGKRYWTTQRARFNATEQFIGRGVRVYYYAAAPYEKDGKDFFFKVELA